MTLMVKNAIGYIWISPDLQENTDKIVEEKRQGMREYCETHQFIFRGLTVDKSLVGTLMERSGLKKVKETLTDNTCVMVDSLSDVGRRFNDVYTMLSHFHDSPTDFISIQENIHTGTPAGQMLLATLKQIPQLCPDAQERRNANHKRSKAARYNGGACPYGYEIDQDTNQYRSLASEAAIIRRIFQERAMGRSLRQIATSLTREGIRTKRGGRWQANTIKTILENIFYTGIYQTNGKMFHNDHEGIIREQLFHQVNNMASEALA